MAANPQGKGLVPILEAWHGVQAAAVEAKTARHIIRDYFTGLLVLSAEFNFKPCLGVAYYLYHSNEQQHRQCWKLSLIAPAEWGEHAPGPCLGRCELNTDMTWQLTIEQDVESKPELVAALQQFHDGFIDLLDRDHTLEEGLPFFVANLPYYRLLFSAGLAGSLSRSMALSSLQGTSSKGWLAGLPHRPLVLVNKEPLL
ncbi:MAG: DUF2452 domain-containing protein [Pseudomonadales bacterium]